jgi:hypothetical protein
VTCVKMATALPLPSTATPVTPPACPARTGNGAAALHVPPERTAYDTPERVRQTVTAVPSFPNRCCGIVLAIS